MLNGIRLLGRLGMLPISSFSALTFFGPCTIFFGMQLNKHRIHVQPINFRFIFMYKTPSWHAGRPIKSCTHITHVFTKLANKQTSTTLVGLGFVSVKPNSVHLVRRTTLNRVIIKFTLIMTQLQFDSQKADLSKEMHFP